MRHRGILKGWKDEAGFGFISPERGGELVYVRIDAFKKKHRRPDLGEAVTYELGKDADGRACAVQVAFVHNAVRTARPGHGWLGATVIAAIFFLLVAAATYLGRLPVLVLGAYLVFSAVTLLTYEVDKSAAKNGRWRVSEALLLGMGLIGGWPGALVAQRLLRHKARKLSFQVVFWITVILNCCALAALLLYSIYEPL